MNCNVLVLYKIILGNKFGFILETSHFLYAVLLVGFEPWVLELRVESSTPVLQGLNNYTRQGSVIVCHSTGSSICTNL